MREGVILDMQRQEMKRQHNIKMLQDQIELTKSLKALQQQQERDIDVNSNNTDTLSDAATT